MNATRKKISNGRRHRSTRRDNTVNEFSPTEYASGDGMLTRVWGPSMWHYLHTMSFNYPSHPTTEDKKKYRSFIYELRHTLPCGKCRANFRINMKKLPIRRADMKSRHTFSTYVYKLHEHVNKMLGKVSGLSYAAVRNQYEHFRARCTAKSSKPTLPSIQSNAISPTKTRKRTKHESGCTEPLYGKKSKCIIKIVPEEARAKTFQVDRSCKRRHRM